MSDTDDARFMRAALNVATEQGVDPARSPIGCVIVRDGRVIAAERNHVEDHHDATAHAEVMAIRAAGSVLGQADLRGAVLYTTLQPCGMCTMAVLWAKIGRVVYGAGRPDVHEMYFEARHVDTLDFIAKAYRDDITIQGGVLRADCAKLYYRPDDDVPEAEQGNT